MKHVTGINGFLASTLLIAALILPVGINKQACANTGLKLNDQTIVPGSKTAGNCEDDYSVSAIKFFNWI